MRRSGVAEPKGDGHEQSQWKRASSRGGKRRGRLHLADIGRDGGTYGPGERSHFNLVFPTASNFTGYVAIAGYLIDVSN
jgi:hypothetical protein